MKCTANVGREDKGSIVWRVATKGQPNGNAIPVTDSRVSESEYSFISNKRD